MQNEKAKPRGGKRTGSPNKLPACIKEMVLGALRDAGGQKYLAQQAIDNPGAFLTLIGKILPRDVNHGGQEDNPVNHKVEIIRTYIAADADKISNS